MSKVINKVEAFTLSEMLVVLLLTVIVVGLAFSVLGLVQGQMQHVQMGYEEKTAGNRLKQALWIDFNTYSNIDFSYQNQTITFRNGITGKTYGFHENYVLNVNDTLYTDFKIGKTFFLGTEVDNGEIDAIELVNEESVARTLFVFKRNTAADFMK